MNWLSAPDITRRIFFLVDQLNLKYIEPGSIFCFRSSGSSGRAIARIWSLPTIWQKALHVPPGYCLEVISEKFDRLSASEQEKVLIHELLHIPKTFSGAVVAHRNARRKTFSHYHREVDALFSRLSTKSYE
jgi:predicted metallopeptidase